MLKRSAIITILAAALFAVFAPVKTVAQDNSDLLVEVPKVPEYIDRLDERCNYIVDNFWKRANLKSAFSSLNRLDETFHQFLAFTPYATADTVHLAINNLIKGVEKADGKNILPLANIVGKYCFGDSAEYQSDELYYPFVEAVAKSKKVKSADKARYQALYRQMSNSRTGTKVKKLDFVCPDGSPGTLADIKTPHVLVFFYEPDCFDCRLAKARLSADYILPSLVENNLLKVVAIYPGEPDEAWREDAGSMPDNWIVGANPDIDRDFIISHNPEIYYLDSRRNVMARGVTVDGALEAFRSLIRAAAVRQAQREAEAAVATGTDETNQTESPTE